MRLSIVERLDAEIVHFFEPATNTIIYSTGCRLHVRRGAALSDFCIPVTALRRPALLSRIARRALRLDKMNAVFTADRQAVIALYQGRIYRCDLRTGTVRPTGGLQQCRNVLHSGISVTPEGTIYFGEYGQNAARNPVPLWKSCDQGESWEKVFEFEAGSIKHVHGVYTDPYTDKLWIPTGDFEGECYLFEADRAFAAVKRHGDGTQRWRAVSLLFEPDHIIWAMDTQLETSFLQVFDRRTESIEQGRAFPGPIWYSKQLGSVSVLQTTCEIGEGVHSNRAHLFASTDNRSWTEIGAYVKDRWPMRYFKFGVIAFADGDQSPDRFAMFGEGLVGLDGVSVIAALT